MTGDVVIRAEGLGKKYVIGHQAEREGYIALRDVIARNTRNIWRTTTDIIRGRPSIAGDEVEEFWALRDINFEVERGEVVGLIGRNGAGKSTLLKILSRITEPTEGSVQIHGRVSSLLEVGTGFHPELTGRENIYLNGAILGMTHAEIRRKFDEIVAFAEVERFLDTPVKRFSSGMYVRLAFAVAAHLEPEILIIDEVLAVGDAEFQKKCLGKMGEVAGEGRTVLFVSHNMGAIQSLCGSAVWLEDGRIRSQGPAIELSRDYLRANTGTPDKVITAGSMTLRCEICASQTQSSHNIHLLTITLTLSKTVIVTHLHVILRTQDGVRLAIFDARRDLALPRRLSPASVTLTFEIDGRSLVPGSYDVDLFLRTGDYIGDIMDIAQLTAVEEDIDLEYPPVEPRYRGLIMLPFSARLDVYPNKQHSLESIP